MSGDERGQNEVAGMVVIIGIAIILGMFFGFVAFQNFTDPGDDVPVVGFEYQHDGDGNLTITHNSGDAVDGDAVFVIVRDGDDVSTARWGTDTIESGDELTVSVPRDGEVTIVWSPADSDRTYIIGEWPVG